MLVHSIATESRTLLERAIEQRAKVVPVFESIVLARVLGDLLMYLDMSDATVAPRLAVDGYWEFWVTQAIARHVKPGMTCIDVGANVGYFTLLMAALVGPSGRVHAYEPQSCEELIALSAAQNGFETRVTSVQRVVGVPGKQTLYLPRRGQRWKRSGDATVLAEGESSLRPGETVQLIYTRGVTLDNEFPDGQVDFIKVDVEGAEPVVWEASRKLRDRCNPVLCMEHDTARVGAGAFLEQIREEGYRVRIVDSAGNLVEMSREPFRVHMLWLTR